MHPYRSLFFTVLELSFLRFSALPVLCAITLPLMPQCLYLLLSHYTVVLFFSLLRSWRLPDSKHGGWGDSCIAEHPPFAEVRQQQNFPWLLKKRKRSSVRCNCSQVFSPTCVPMCWTRGANEITLGKFNIRQDNLELPETSIIKGLQDWVGKCYSELLTWAWDGSVAEVSWGCTMHLYSQCVCFTLACCAGVMTTLRRSWQWCLLHLWGQRIWQAKVGEFS